MKIYFAASIRGGRDDRELYLEIINLLSNFGQVLTEHIGDQGLSVFGENESTDEYIYKRDIMWLKQADVVVAEVTTPSLGVGYELAKVEGTKPLLCIFRQQSGRRISAMISGNKNFKLRVYKNLSDLNHIFNDFFNKKDI